MPDLTSLVLALVVMANPLAAQSAPDPGPAPPGDPPGIAPPGDRHGFALVGLGLTAEGGLAGRIGATLGRGRWTVGTRWTVHPGRASRYDAFMGGKLRDEFYDGGILVGRDLAPAGSSGQVLLSVGVARVWGGRVVPDPSGWFSGGKREDVEPRLGVPVELLLLGPIGGTTRWGVGLGLYADINGEASLFGVTGNIGVGRLRPR